MDKYPKNPNETENNNNETSANNPVSNEQKIINKAENSANNPVPNDGEPTKEQIEAKLAQEVYDFVMAMFPTPQHCMAYNAHLIEAYFELEPDKTFNEESEKKKVISHSSMILDFNELFELIHPVC